MQQHRSRQISVRRGPMEPYPEPIAGAPAPWPEALAPRPAPGPEVLAPTPAAATGPDGHAVRHPLPAGGGGGNGAAPNRELEGVYIISVAARLLEMHPQTLRKYERLGLIQPVRTVGMLRLYSQEDLRKVMLIRHLMDNLGLNLAGVEFALKLVNNLNVFSHRLARATGDAAVVENIQHEVALLCGSLSLPAPE